MKSKILLVLTGVMIVGAHVARAEPPSEPAAAVDPTTSVYPGGTTIQPPPPTSTAVVVSQPVPVARPLPDAKLPKSAELRGLLENFADAQLADEPDAFTPWQQGVFLSGAMALDGMSASPRFREAVLALGTKDAWKSADLGPGYGDVWQVFREPIMLAAARAELDRQLEPAEAGNEQPVKQRWENAEKLLQSAPVWARVYGVTGQKKYRDALVKRWKETSGLLFDAEGSLFHRDFAAFDRERDASPRRFDGLANGCAVAGLARVLQLLPENDVAREDLADQFQTMARRLVDLRLTGGGWAATLAVGNVESPLDVATTALISFGLASGVNQGLLKADAIQPVVAQAWAAVEGAVKPAAVADPKADKGSEFKAFAPHAAGGLLLAGAELYRMAVVNEAAGHATVRVENPAAIGRQQETIEIKWEDITGRAKMVSPESVTIFDAQTSRILDSQLLDVDGNQNPEALLIQSDFLPGQAKQFVVVTGPNRDQQPQSPLTTFGRFVPERFDDFAWENDRIAYRVYGPALLKEPGELGGSGIDVWCKRVRWPVVDKWYATDDYSEDKGEGCDFYRVGQTRGCGGSGVLVGNRIAGASDFAKWKILANGPIRTVFELTYEPWSSRIRSVIETNAAKVLSPEALSNEVAVAAFEKNAAEQVANEAAAEAAAPRYSETKTITLDRGANLNKIVSVFSAQTSDPFEFVTGIATQPGDSRLTKDKEAGWLTYTTPAEPPNGSVHCALLCVNAFSPSLREADGHHAISMNATAGQLIPYYAGAAWSKGLDFPTHESWTAYVKNFAARIAAPLRVSVK